MSHCLPSSPPRPAAPTFQIAASSKQTQLITGPSLAVGTPCFSRTVVLLPIGLDPGDIDPIWISTLDAFGTNRGEVVHTSIKTQQQIDPQNELNTMKDILQ